MMSPSELLPIEEIVERESTGVRFLAQPPARPCASVEVCQGIWWIQLPISTPLKSVNCYILDDGNRLTLVDTGSNQRIARQQLEVVLSSAPFAGKSIHRVIATHFHPDHIGLAGILARDRVTFETSQTCWNAARQLWSDQPDLPRAEHVDFVQGAGVSKLELAAFRRNRPTTYADSVAELPNAYRRLQEGDTLQIGDRQWRIHMGYGHADEHITLWSNDNIAIVGDQILPAVSPNLSVHFTKPDANPIGGWLDSCRRFATLANDETTCLPGHNRPFQGAPHRCRQLIENCEMAIDRLRKHLPKPATAVDCLAAIYRRPIEGYERLLLIGETIGYLNYLIEVGSIDRRHTKAGHYLYRLARNFDIHGK